MPSTPPLWQRTAVDLAALIRRRQISAREATRAVLDRVAEVNPRVNALTEVMTDEALAAADACDRALHAGTAPGLLHGVPVTIKVNVDVAGHATTEGIVAAKDAIALTDSPLVANLRAAGAIVAGRTNTPAFSLRWFTDNDLHGRTLNPIDPTVTPGGSSGGAAAAVATGMGPIAHGNDYGGSIRYPAWACGVVGLRTTVGRVPAYKATSPGRVVSNQMMSVQGPLTRSVADARLALAVMSRPSPLDPQWVPAPLAWPEATGRPLRVAVFARHADFEADATVVAAVEQAARWLEAAGCDVEHATPPHFTEGTQLWRRLVMDDLRRAGLPMVEARGDHRVRSALRGYMHGLEPSSANGVLEAQARRFDIAREWSVFLDRYDVLVMPVSWQRQFPLDADVGPADAVSRLVPVQSPLLVTAMLGLPGLAVPTGMADGLPAGVQLVATKFREDLALRAGEMIERAAAFDVFEHLLD